MHAVFVATSARVDARERLGRSQRMHQNTVHQRALANAFLANDQHRVRARQRISLLLRFEQRILRVRYSVVDCLERRSPLLTQCRGGVVQSLRSSTVAVQHRLHAVNQGVNRKRVVARNDSCPGLLIQRA